MTEIDNIKFTDGTNILFVGTNKVDENYNNEIKIIPYPTDTDTPKTPLSINLNKLTDRFTINGYLIYGKLDATDTWTTAKAKKDGFKTMIGGGSTITMTYEGDNYTVSVDKYQITRIANDNTDSEDGEVVYDVTITCIVTDEVVGGE